jgi:hypothetical protein
MMKIRAREANRLPGLKWPRGGVGLFPRRSDRFNHHVEPVIDSLARDKFRYRP